MSQRMWLLVEWIDERNVFPTYSIVNVDTLAYNEAEMNPGKHFFIQIKHASPRRALIMKISENKGYLKEQKELLERQDQKVKKVLHLCMRTIKEMKSDQVYIDAKETIQQHTGHENTLSYCVVNAKTEESSCESDSEENNHININQSFSRANHLDTSLIRLQSQNRPLPKQLYNRTLQNYAKFRNQTLTSSTPLPGNSIYKLYIDQATQTDAALLQPPIAKIEELESLLKNLYQRFQALDTQVNLNQETASYCVSESEQYEGDNLHEASLPVDDCVNNHYKERLSIEKRERTVTKQELENATTEPVVNSSTVPIETKEIANNVSIRRMSAQTTNNIEAGPSNDADMVPIGNGNAVVPARLLKDLDWNHYTSATRQLLQAIFSRRVLATHSLTGKQSPAFKNKPPKKILDPKLVEDIVMIVSTECGVPKNLVRNTITVKCTDEAKLYRNRQSYRRARQTDHQNEENIPLGSASSDESSAVTH